MHAAKLPYVSGDGAARKPSLQTHATSPAVSAAALSQDALQEPSLLQPDLRVDLEKLYTMNGEPAAESSSEQSSQALEDMEALLEDLQGLDLELDAALETVLEDFSELTVRNAAACACNVRGAIPHCTTATRLPHSFAPSRYIVRAGGGPRAVGGAAAEAAGQDAHKGEQGHARAEHQARARAAHAQAET